MNRTVPPERTVTAAELADHAARAERALAGRQLPRTIHALREQGARLVQCPVCWQRPGLRCTRFYPPGDHLGRYQRAERQGLITRAELGSVVAALEVIAAHVIIRDEVSR
jgi:hypothetical protein